MKTRSGTGRSERWGVLVQLVALGTGVAFLLAACGSSKQSGSSDRGSTSTTNTVPAPAGLPAFYSVPDPLPAGSPGDIIKVEQVNGYATHGTLWRVMYHSQSIRGDDIPVTGMIAVPSSPAPDSGYPVIGYAHGTVGLADICAQSAKPEDIGGPAGTRRGHGGEFLNPMLDEGYVVAWTDYPGLGTPGRLPYYVGVAAARGVIDSVRAARALPGVQVSNRFASLGQSEGGHAALWVSNIAAEWAPELQLVGTVASAPGTQLHDVGLALQNSRFGIYNLLVPVGLNAGYGDQAAPLDAILTDEGRQALDKIDTTCLSDLVALYQGQPSTAFLSIDPYSDPTWARLFEENDPGQFTSPSPQPLLIVQGTNDEQVPVATSKTTFDHLCSLNQVAQRWIYPNLDHASVIDIWWADVLPWIDHRFAGEPAPDPMTPTGVPGVQTEQCPTA